MGSRAKLIVGGAVTYVTAVACSYTYLKARPPAPVPKEGCGCCSAPFSERSTRQFNEIAMLYDEKINMDEFVMGVKVLRRYLVWKARGRVLEVASGTGRNLDYYNFGGFGGLLSVLAGVLGFRREEDVVTKLVLTDKSEEMVKTAINKVTKMGIKTDVEIDVGDSSDLSRFADNSFDTVVDTFGLCSFDDPVKVLVEMQRVCRKDGGVILLMEHGRSNYWEWLDKVLDEGRDKHVEKWGCEWNRDIDKIINDSGLLVESCSKWHFGTTTVILAKPRPP